MVQWAEVVYSRTKNIGYGFIVRPSKFQDDWGTLIQQSPIPESGKVRNFLIINDEFTFIGTIGDREKVLGVNEYKGHNFKAIDGRAGTLICGYMSRDKNALEFLPFDINNVDPDRYSLFRDDLANANEENSKLVRFSKHREFPRKIISGKISKNINESGWYWMDGNNLQFQDFGIWGDKKPQNKSTIKDPKEKRQSLWDRVEKNNKNTDCIFKTLRTTIGKITGLCCAGVVVGSIYYMHQKNKEEYSKDSNSSWVERLANRNVNEMGR